MYLFHQFFDVWSKSTLMMLLVLAACGDSEEGSQQETDEGKQEILLYYGITIGSEDALKEILADYNESQDEVEVVAEYVKFDEMNRQLSVGTAGDTLPDIVIADTVNNVSMASMGILADITPYVEEWGYIDLYSR